MTPAEIRETFALIGGVLHWRERPREAFQTKSQWQGWNRRHAGAPVAHDKRRDGITISHGDQRIPIVEILNALHPTLYLDPKYGLDTRLRPEHFPSDPVLGLSTLLHPMLAPFGRDRRIRLRNLSLDFHDENRTKASPDKDKEMRQLRRELGITWKTLQPYSVSLENRKRQARSAIRAALEKVFEPLDVPFRWHYDFENRATPVVEDGFGGVSVFGMFRVETEFFVAACNLVDMQRRLEVAERSGVPVVRLPPVRLFNPVDVALSEVATAQKKPIPLRDRDIQFFRRLFSMQGVSRIIYRKINEGDWFWLLMNGHLKLEDRVPSAQEFVRAWNAERAGTAFLLWESAERAWVLDSPGVTFEELRSILLQP